MTKTRIILLSACTLFVGMTLPAKANTDIAAHLERGHAAWDRGEYSAAVNEWRDLADGGNADAQFNMAQAYRQGRGVKADRVRAEALMAKAAAQGHARAIDLYGLLLFQDGREEEAMPYVILSADRGNARAQYLLGIGHFNGKLVAKDWVRAYALMTMSSQGGLEQANAAIAQMDGYIPASQRAAGVNLAKKMSSQNGVISNPIAQPVAYTVTADRPANTSILRVDSPSATDRATINTAQVPTEADGPWRIQVGAFAVQSNADRLWSRLSKRADLRDKRKFLVPTGRVVQLRIGGFADSQSAQTICDDLKRNGQDCLVLQ